MKEVYILLEWMYDGDSYLFNDFKGAYLTEEEAKKKAQEIHTKNIKTSKKCDVSVEYVSFINYSTKETSNIFIEGYEPEEFKNPNGRKFEIRKISFRDYSDWNIENPEKIKCCSKCNLPIELLVKSKQRETAYYICTCNWDFENVPKLY